MLIPEFNHGTGDIVLRLTNARSCAMYLVICVRDEERCWNLHLNRMFATRMRDLLRHEKKKKKPVKDKMVEYPLLMYMVDSLFGL